jgi:hypothetical protein
MARAKASARAARGVSLPPMRRAILVACTFVLLAGPTVLAFFAGGYFDGSRAVAAGLAWAIVLVLAIAGPLPLPASRPGAVALAGLVALTAWSAVSLAWAPLYGPAIDSVQRLLLYVGALLAAVALLRDPRAARAVEPMLALGALVAIGYGLAGRLVPGVVDLIPPRSFGAGGRLEQPITYWNAEGLLAAMGLVLCVRLAGDRSRQPAMRVAAATACAPLGMGVYLSYSRGALAVAGVGLVVLLAAAPTWPQLRAAVIGVVSGAVAAACSAIFPGVASLNGTLGARESDGAIMLAILVVVMAGAALVAARAVQAEWRGTAPMGVLSVAPRLPALATAATALCVVGLVIGSLSEQGDRGQSSGAGVSRLASLTSVRYEYWRVGVNAFLDDPARGTGAGGFRVAWRQHRRVNTGANEVHSLVLEMVAELGVLGLAFLSLFVGGVAAAGREALRRRAPLAPGACAVCIVWLLHAAIDWDWQLTAVTLPALVLAGGLLAASERPSLPVALDTPPAEPDRQREPITLAAG